MSIGSRRTVQIAIIGLVISALGAYGLFQARTLLEGPQVAIQYPTDGSTVQQSLVELEGSTENITSIEVNDRTIHVNRKGQFTEPVVLSQGYNVITIEATDRFGRSTTDRLEVVHKPLGQDDTELTQTPDLPTAN